MNKKNKTLINHFINIRKYENNKDIWAIFKREKQAKLEHKINPLWRMSLNFGEHLQLNNNCRENLQKVQHDF